jgi:hypothetical protein
MSLEEMSLADFQDLMSCEIDGPGHVMQAALRGPARPGRAVVHALQVDPANLHLRSAAEFLLKSAAREVIGSSAPARLNAVHAAADAPLQELVDTISFLLSPDSRFMTGATLRLGLPE